MYSNRTILGLIPARGSSKGLPRKNIKLLLGKPLIAWTIERAKECKYFDRVIVTTDDEEIARIAKEYRAEVPFLRPNILASDVSPAIDTILHALNYLRANGETFDYIAWLEPTSPLRDRHDFNSGIEVLINNETRADSLVSVGKIALEHPFMVKKIDKNGYMSPFCVTDEKLVGRRQDLPPAYFPYGVLYLSKVHTLNKDEVFYQKRAISYPIQRWQNFEIDDEIDFFTVETIMRKYWDKFSSEVSYCG